MTDTSNIEITELDSGLLQPDVAVNEGFRIIDAAIAATLTHDMASDANYSLKNDTSDNDPADREWRYRIIEITDTGVVLTAARDIVYPAENGPPFIFLNNTAQTLTVKISGQSGVAVEASGMACLWYDGTDVVRYVDADYVAFTSATGGIASGNVGDALREIQDQLDSDSTRIFNGNSNVTVESSNGVISVDTNGTQAAYITTTQKVSLGPASDTSPDGALHVISASAGSVTASTSADEIVAENNGDGGISILTPNTATGGLFFGDPDDNDVGQIVYDHNTNTMQVVTGAAVTMQFTANTMSVGVSPPATPDGTLHVHPGTAGSFTANGAANDVVIENNTNSGLTIASPATALCSIYFADTGSAVAGFIEYNHNTDRMSFGTTASTRFYVASDGGVVVGSPTGGSQGAGTVNATAVYDDGSILTDYVFDAEIDGVVDIEKWDAAVPNRVYRNVITAAEEAVIERTPKKGGGFTEVVVKPAVEEVVEDVEDVRVHIPARNFSSNMDELDIKAFENKWRTSRKLPAFERITEKPSVGEIAQALLETCEVQAVHIAKLYAEIEALKGN